MNSWRESASPAAQDDLDVAFGDAVDAAFHLLRKNGEFFPIGVVVTGGGDLQHVMADPGLGEQPPSDEVLRALYEGTREHRDELRAVATACDVRLADGGDAVRVDLEHREGVALSIVTPYRRSRLTRKVTTGDMLVSLGEARIWTSST